jgi:hypothetical protein
VPLTVLNGPLKAVVGPPLGDLASEIEPALLEWHWYYHLPDFAGWALILALLVLVKDNRNWQAWIILIPFALLSEVLWPWVESLFSLGSLSREHVAAAFQSLIVAWTALWLLGPWLARCRPTFAVILALGLTAMLGMGAQRALRGYWPFGLTLVEDLVASLPLVLAFVLSGLCCRRRYTPWKFSLWLLFWLPAAVLTGVACEVAGIFAQQPERLSTLPAMLPRLAIAALSLAGPLYLFNLPYMLLAAKCPLYRDRFCKVLRLPTALPPLVTPPPEAAFDETAELT